MAKRTILLDFDHYDNGDGASPHDRTVAQAIGYLSLWAITNGRYCNVSIYGMENGDISTAYRNDKGDVTYTMLAVRREDGTFGFHS